MYHMRTGAQGGQKSTSDPLELQVTMYHPMWVLGTEFKSYRGTVSDLNAQPALMVSDDTIQVPTGEN